MKRTSENIGVCLDTAWMLDAGAKPADAIRKLGNRILELHLKDFTFDAEGNQVDVILGKGYCDFTAINEVLKEIGFKGYAVLEYEGEPENPVNSIKECSKVASGKA